MMIQQYLSFKYPSFTDEQRRAMEYQMLSNQPKVTQFDDEYESNQQDQGYLDEERSSDISNLKYGLEIKDNYQQKNFNDESQINHNENNQSYDIDHKMD